MDNIQENETVINEDGTLTIYQTANDIIDNNNNNIIEDINMIEINISNEGDIITNII